MKARRRNGSRYLSFWCPGCEKPHGVIVEGEGAWGWNGDMDAVTLTPSVLVTMPGTPSRCHSFVRNGQIEFLGDCSHSLAGKTVPLGDWPWEP